MDPKNALQIVKNIIDGSLKAGLCQNLEEANTALAAYQTLFSVVHPKQDPTLSNVEEPKA